MILGSYLDNVTCDDVLARHEPVFHLLRALKHRGQLKPGQVLDRKGCGMINNMGVVMSIDLRCEFDGRERGVVRYNTNLNSGCGLPH